LGEYERRIETETNLLKKRGGGGDLRKLEKIGHLKNGIGRIGNLKKNLRKPEISPKK
jgi:hypothetical protein